MEPLEFDRQFRDAIQLAARQLLLLFGPEFVGRIEINAKEGGEPKVNYTRSL